MKKKKCLDIVRVEIDPMEITIHREQYKGLRMAEDIIRKHMNDGWIPANKPPETRRRCLVKMKHHAWFSDYESKTIPESEKVYHAEYVEICEAIYLGNNEWKYLCLESEIYESTAFTKPYPTLSVPLDEVIEWKYMSQLQPETCKYTGGSYCWPIDQCSDCPNNPERSNGE